MNRTTGYTRWVLGLLWLGAWLTRASVEPYVQSVLTDAVRVDAARGVIERLLPGVSRDFELRIIPKEDGLDVFELESEDSNIVVRGSGGPLPQSWIDSNLVLGSKILEQERALGMTPIQQGFTRPE